MVIASELKGGMVLRIEGEIYKVLGVEFKAGTAKLSGVVKTQLHNILTGSMWERHFRPQERLEDVQLEQRTLEFLFSDADSCTFMNPENFEQVEVPRAIVGAAEGFLQSGNSYQEPRQFTLPNSHFVVRYSTRYYKFFDGRDNVIAPDKEIAPTWDDYKNGRDAAMEWVLALKR
jgi:elongation factor P